MNIQIKDIVKLETERFGTIIGEVIELNDEWVKLKLHTTIEGNNTICDIGDEKSFRLSLISKITIISEANYKYLLLIENTTRFGSRIRPLDARGAAELLKEFQADDECKVTPDVDGVHQGLTIKWRVMCNGWYFTLLKLNEDQEPFVLSHYKNVRG